MEVVRIKLQLMTVNLYVSTDPNEAVVSLNGEKQGNSPLVVPELACGTHFFVVAKDGYVTRDTSLSVTPSTKELSLSLVQETRGILIVRGAPDELSAKIYIDNKQVGSAELLSSGEKEVTAGHHTIVVVFRNGSDSMSVEVPTGGRVELVWEAQKLRPGP